jgi:hypothetical protein
MEGRGAPIVVSHCIAMLSLVVRQLVVFEDVNMEAEELRMLETTTRQLVKT